MSNQMQRVAPDVPASTGDRKMDLFRKTIVGNDVTNDEFELARAQADHMGLDLLTGEAHALKFRGRLATAPSVHGWRKLASLSGLFDGTDGPYFCGADGVWMQVWLDEKVPPKAAKFTVFRKDTDKPFTAVVTWKERARRKNDGGLMETWAAMPSHMLGIRAETDAFKKARLMPGSVVETTGHVVDRNKAMARVHAVAHEQGLDHEFVRDVVMSLEPGVDSLTDPQVTGETLHAAASLIETLGARALEPGDPGVPGAVTADEEWRIRIRETIDSQNKAAWDTLFVDAGVDESRWAAMLELAPSKSYATRIETKAKAAGVWGDTAQDAQRAQKDATEVARVAEAREAQDIASIEAADEADYYEVDQETGELPGMPEAVGAERYTR